MRDIHIHMTDNSQPITITVETEDDFIELQHKIKHAVIHNGPVILPDSDFALINGRYITFVSSTKSYEPYNPSMFEEAPF